MKRCLVALISFIIFIIEFLIQSFKILIDVISTIPVIFLICLCRYHNRIQFFTSKNSFFIIEETEKV
jgi:hypothetical protein